MGGGGVEGSGPEGQAGDLGAPLTSLKTWPAQQEARQRKGQAPVPGEDSGVRDQGPAAVGRSGSAHRPRFKPELCTEGDQARGDRIPEVSRPTPGEAEGAGATRGPASDPSTRQRQLQPRAPTGPRGRWVTATQVPTVRPAPTRRTPRWTGCSLSAPAWGPCARGLCRGPGPGRSTFHLAVPSKASHRLRAHHTPAGLSGRRQMASRVPGAGGPQPRPRGGPASEAPSASAAATSAPPPPQVLVSGDPRRLAPQRAGAWTASHMSPWCSYALPPPSAAGPPPLSGLRGRILP